MKILPASLKNSKGVIMVIAIVILLAITAIGLGMVTNAAMSSTIAKNYKNRIMAFYAADGQMTVLSQAVLDSLDTNWVRLDTNRSTAEGDTSWTITSGTASDVQGSYVVANAYDGNSGTRFTTNTSIANPWIQVDLGQVRDIYKVSIWPYAGGGGTRRHYLSFKIDGVEKLKDTVESTQAFQDFTFSHTNGQVVKIQELSPGNSDGNWYLGIYELKISGSGGGYTIDTLFPQATMKITASTTSAGSANNVKDNNTSTSWASSPVDPSWICANCGSQIYISKVIIDWSSATSANTYALQGSNDASNWSDLGTKSSSVATDHRLDTLKGLDGCFQFFRMNGTSRNGSGNGYCIYEMKVYAYRIPQPFDTTAYGQYKVQWRIKRSGFYKYTLQTTAFDSLKTWGTVFKTPLRQDIDRLWGGGFAAPAKQAKIPVTFYDYHSNRTNPEFEQPCLNAVQKGMVGVTLDGQRKPVLGPTPCLNYCIAKWFRPWVAGDNTIPVYKQTVLSYTTVDSAGTHSLVRWTRPGAWRGGEWGNASCNEVNSVAMGQNPITETTNPLFDQAFKNIVIQDSLPFTYVNGTQGTYTYSNGAFFLLDGRGFGNEWACTYQDSGVVTPTPDPANADVINAGGGWPHNFSYTMEVKRTFKMVPGLTFVFSGDDDIWLFLNNRLQMDLGGPHSATSWTVNVDTVHDAGGALLVNMTDYNFDFFYCERHSSNSSIAITTNLLYYIPSQAQQRSWKRDYGSVD